MVALEGLQPMITEAFVKGDNIQCGLDAVNKSNWIVMTFVFNIFGFAVVVAPFKIYKHLEMLHEDVVVHSTRFKSGFLETIAKRIDN